MAGRVAEGVAVDRVHPRRGPHDGVLPPLSAASEADEADAVCG